jgi:hypothetical protein
MNNVQKYLTISDNTNCSYKIKYISHRNVCDITVVMKSYLLILYVIYMLISTKREQFGFSPIFFDRMWLLLWLKYITETY